MPCEVFETCQEINKGSEKTLAWVDWVKDHKVQYPSNIFFLFKIQKCQKESKLYAETGNKAITFI